MTIHLQPGEYAQYMGVRVEIVQRLADGRVLAQPIEGGAFIIISKPMMAVIETIETAKRCPAGLGGHHRDGGCPHCTN